MEILILVIKAAFALSVVLGLASLCTWIERKGSALIQDRIGANRAGAFLQSDWWLTKPVSAALRPLGALGVINTFVCDPVKALFKEDFVPAGASRFLHALAPFAAVLPVFLAFTVVPLAPRFSVLGHEIRLQVAPLNAGAVFVIAMGTLSVYGVMLAGWVSGNKFSILGGVRAAAQMFSYELSLGVTLTCMFTVYGTLDLYSMVEAQGSFWSWGVFRQPLALVLLLVVGMAESKRVPFDLPEAESELVAGYFTEYSGMKFLLFWVAEFAEVALFSLLISLLFFGGWQIPFVNLPAGEWWAALIGHMALMGKVVVLCTLQIVIRWTLPRFRFDQLMGLGWKILLPVSMANFVITAAGVLLLAG